MSYPPALWPLYALLVTLLLVIPLASWAGVNGSGANGNGSNTASSERLPDVTLGLLRYSGSGEGWNPRPSGLSRLAWEVRKRTSIDIGLEVVAVDPLSTEFSRSLFAHPLVFWQGEQGFSPLSKQAIHNLRQFLRMGGTLVVDLSDGNPRGDFYRSVRATLQQILPQHKVARIPTSHVLYKSFYLLQRHGGRVAARSFLEGITLDKRLAVLIYGNDMAGALARDQFGQWIYDVGSGGEASRETTFRVGINILMYALCLDYKEDQVHIPFILKRRS